MFVLFVSCQKEGYNFEFSGENVNKYQEKTALEFSRTLEIDIDSLFSVNFIHSIVPFRDNGKRYFGILHQRDIYIYEEGNGKPEKKNSIDEEGPNGVKSIESFDGISIRSLDTFHLVTNTNGLLYTIDGDGAVIEKTAAPVDPARSDTYDYGFIRARLIRDQLLIPTYGFNNTKDFTNLPTRFIYDYKEKDFKPAFNYPSIFNDFYWGYNTLLRHSSCDYNPSKKEYYVSYSIDPHVYIYDEKYNLKRKKILGSTYFSSIFPQDEDANRRFQNEGSATPGNDEYFMALSYFTGGYFHTARNYYLRITRIGIDKEKGQGVKFSIIIADEDLNKVGEYMIPSHYLLESFFLVDEGIAFINMEKYDLDAENKLVFDVLKFSDLQ